MYIGKIPASQPGVKICPVNMYAGTLKSAIILLAELGVILYGRHTREHAYGIGGATKQDPKTEGPIVGTGEAGMDETGNQAGDQGPGSTPKGPVWLGRPTARARPERARRALRAPCTHKASLRAARARPGSGAA